MDAIEHVSRALADHGDRVRARSMAAYMRTDMPFWGVQADQRRPIVRTLKRDFAPVDGTGYRRLVSSLWNLPHREEKYIAIDVAIIHGRFVTLDQLDLYERMIREGAWWDLVDPISSKLVGRLHRADPDQMTPILRAWGDDPDMWIRRTAIIAQLGHEEATDPALLFDVCRARASETEFFIRKAIGWALRKYARTDPEAVWRFVDAMGGRLSGLSRREATKHRPD